jgi:histone-lysine N-methyltransferase SETD8
MDPAVLGLVVKQTENMERGLFAGRDIGSGEWVVEYDGILLSQGEADKRTMEKDGFTAYFFWFKEDGRWFCIDASQDSPHPGRLINHSRAAYNLVAKKVPGELRVAFRSSRDISAGEELFFDYNDRRKEVLSSVLWMDK